MSEWGRAIAGAIGGAAGAASNQMRFDQTEDFKRQVQELRAQLAVMNEGGRNDRATAANEMKSAIAEANRTAARIKADADREQRANAVTANVDLGYAGLASREGIAGTHEETARRAQDMEDAWRWNGLMSMTYDAHAVSKGNSERTNATSRANALTTAATSTANAGTAAGTADKNRRAHSIVEFLKMNQANKNSLLAGNEDDPEKYAADYDALYNDPDRLAAEALQASGGGAAVPVAPRQAPAAAAAPGASQTVKSVKLGELQKLAQLRGTSVDEQKRRAVAEGFTIVP